MVRIGIVGCNYGHLVQLPAFRLDPRCEVVALAGRDATRTAELANEANIPLAFGNWERITLHEVRAPELKCFEGMTVAGR